MLRIIQVARNSISSVVIVRSNIISTTSKELMSSKELSDLSFLHLPRSFTDSLRLTNTKYFASLFEK